MVSIGQKSHMVKSSISGGGTYTPPSGEHLLRDLQGRNPVLMDSKHLREYYCLSQHLLNICFVPDTVLSTGDTAVNNINKVSAFMELSNS